MAFSLLRHGVTPQLVASPYVFVSLLAKVA